MIKEVPIIAAMTYMHHHTHCLVCVPNRGLIVKLVQMGTLFNDIYYN